ncbi:glycoside hydrolase family 36 protein [Wenyingzhuangia sp. IMCC45574]
MIKDTIHILENDIEIIGGGEGKKVTITPLFQVESVSVFDIHIKSQEVKPLTLQWKVPAYNVKGTWKPTTDFAKRIMADWELDHMESRISIDAPVVSLFGHDDSNRMTFACSNAINKLELNARIREENDMYYCFVTLFTEPTELEKDFSMQLRIDTRDIHFSESIKEVASWWETFEELKPTPVPEIATMPLYSTWYNFHQNLDEESLIEECKLAYDLGYRAIIIDDGWQTKDDNRGYDFTGDWKPERLNKTKEFVDAVHATGMKVGFWYSVPFCGKKSEAYPKFKDKLLTDDHRWAPVFDPRYPEVRQYLIDIYKSALVEWGLDGFKLDFIDDFRFYPQTKAEKSDEMDYESINEAVDRLLTDVITTLRAINPDVFIEFRQKYTGPAMRKYGNMFRAFDCPGDAVMNRIRIADIKMLAGNTAVHSDMITWHKEETVEVAALQMVNTLFGVPQISILLKDYPQDHINMVRFYTQYWNENRALITTGNLTAFNPLANYPIKQVVKSNKMLLGVFDDSLAPVKHKVDSLDILNGKLTNKLILELGEDFGTYSGIVYDCEGRIVKEDDYKLAQGVCSIDVPACGLIRLTKK